MKEFFDMPLIFWFLFCTGAQALIQTRFLIKFSKIAPKRYYYAVFVGVSYVVYVLEIAAPFQPGFISRITSLLIGIGIIYIFSWKMLKQNRVTSIVMAALLITTNILIEGLITPLQHIVTMVFGIPQTVSTIALGLLILASTYILLHFFSTRYTLKSNDHLQYLFILVMPLLFIDIVVRQLIDFRYFSIGMNYDYASQITLNQNYQFLGLSAFAFLCVCGMLYGYEKVLLAFENEQQKKLLLNELHLQEKYVSEAKARHEATRIFRHDLKNHIIALNGMIEKNELTMASKYLERFEAVSDYITSPFSTGNMVIDIILSEKLSYAKSIGIELKCDVTIPSSVHIDDFDLSVIFSNGIDNAIRACSCVVSGTKTLAVMAKQNKDFFLFDIQNNYEENTVPSGSGLGLPSIKMVVEKYQGAVETNSDKGIFRLSVLLPFENN